MFVIYLKSYDLIKIWVFSVTMQAQKEAPIDMQCKDKFLVQSVIASAGAAAKDVTAEMVILLEPSNR